MNRSMRGDARYAEASALLERNAVRQRYGLRGGHDDILGRSAERAIGLRPVAPHALADSRARDALPDAVDGPRSIAVGNHARGRHAVAESVLTLLNVTRIDSGCSDPDTHLAWLRLRVGQRADDENLSGWTLLFVPRGVHPYLLGTRRRSSTERLSMIGHPRPCFPVPHAAISAFNADWIARRSVIFLSTSSRLRSARMRVSRQWSPVDSRSSSCTSSSENPSP